MHKRRRPSPSAKSTADQSAEKQHVLPDSIAKGNRENCRETKGARWSRRTCKPRTGKRAQATSFQLASHVSSKGFPSVSSFHNREQLNRYRAPCGISFSLPAFQYLKTSNYP